MGVFADRLATMELRESTPDGCVEGRFTKADGLSLSFGNRSYDHYTERGLESQLGGLCTRLRASYLRYRAGALAEATGRPVDAFLRRERDPDARGHRLEIERAKTVLKGMSPRALVYIESTGLKQWRVIIRDGTLTAVTQDEFDREMAGAYQAVMTDNDDTMNALRDKYYGR